jgi:dihydropteroate synthase
MNFLVNQSINCGNKELNLSVPVVMGILNLTPDSFFDGGSYHTTAEMIDKVRQMITDGATIVDIGALSTRPGAMQLNADEELNRLIEPLKIIRQEFPELIISIDTYRKKVAEAAVNEGADIINDISGGLMDEDMIPFMCTQQAAYVIMHMQGNPENMQLNPHYNDVVHEVESFFLQQVAIFKKAGKHNLILDPGFGFGKTVEHNYQLLQAISKYAVYPYPVLAGVSRKSMINKVLGTKAAEALNGTTVINTIALLKGATILRVHDVKAAIEAIKLVRVFNEANMAISGLI